LTDWRQDLHAEFGIFCFACATLAGNDNSLISIILEKTAVCFCCYCEYMWL
jgi:hypothetical protein